MNYFDHFGLEETFMVDQEKLRKAFLIKSRAVHPDLNRSGSEDDLDQLSSINNEAYNTLKDELLVIHHVLEINGVDSFANLQPTHEFLAEMMELNEMIDEAKDSEDMNKISDCEAAIQNLEKEAMKKWLPYKNQYRPDLPDSDKFEIFQQAGRFIMLMKYSNRMRSLLMHKIEL